MTTASAQTGADVLRAQELLAFGVENSRDLMFRYLAGFAESNRTTQAPALPNHVVWNLGHCALTMHRVAERYLDRQAPPADDFVTGDGTAGDATKFDTASVSFGSAPIDDPSRYPTLERAQAIFNRAVDHLATAIRRASDEDLTQMVPWGSSAELPLYSLIHRMVFHNGTHTGQLTDLRRALDLGNIL